MAFQWAVFSAVSRCLVAALLCLVSVSLSASVLPPQASSQTAEQHQCRCVPDQWQGILSSADREFDLESGGMGSAKSNLYVSYDFANKRFAMTDLKTGNKAVADYAKGFKYVMRDDGCRGIRTGEQMRQMCLPDHAEYLGEFTLGTEVPVDLWQFTGPNNVSMKTTVIQKNCVPITEEVFMSRGHFVSMQSSMYLDVAVGIRDASVYDVPVTCVMHAAKSPYGHPHQAKRDPQYDGPWNLMYMLGDEDF